MKRKQTKISNFFQKKVKGSENYESENTPPTPETVLSPKKKSAGKTVLLENSSSASVTKLLFKNENQLASDNLTTFSEEFLKVNPSPPPLSPPPVPSTINLDNPDNSSSNLLSDAMPKGLKLEEDEKEDIQTFFKDLEDELIFFETPPDSKSKEDILLASLNTDNFLTNEDWDSSSKSDLALWTLTFETPQHCKVIKSESKNFELHLWVQEKDSKSMGCCILRDMWALNITPVENDHFCIFASLLNGKWVVDAQNGYVVCHPDTLISSTSLVGSSYCRRKGVLSTIFKNMDAGKKVMVIGQFVHEVLQIAVENPSKELNEIIDDVLSNPNRLRVLFSCDLDDFRIKQELSEYIGHIKTFLNTYIKGTDVPFKHNFQGSISEVIDIEENLISRNLGMKGRIDITSRVLLNGMEKLVPIEVKTGRASFSPEHKGQVILYVMMMTDLGRVVESGLLLYLKEGLVEEIKPSRMDIRDLILLRNDLAQYLVAAHPLRFPDPISRINSCSKCFLLNICKSYLGKEHSLRKIGAELADSHVEYFNLWSKLAYMEDNGEKRVEGLEVEEIVDLTYHFKGTVNELKLGSLVKIFSVDYTFACTGKIVECYAAYCTIVLEEKLPDLTSKYSVQTSSFLSKYMTNLGWLMNEEYKKYREIIIDLKPGTFKKIKKSLVTPEFKIILSKLNNHQQRAVLKVLSADDFCLIEGPPGTGKTQTVVALLDLLLLLNKKILIASHTHSAVDNILRKLSHKRFLRLGGLKSIDPELHENCYENLKNSCKSSAELQSLFDRPIIASTCFGLDSDLMLKNLFDVCIIDEASQVLQPEAFKPIFSSKKFVLIGDPHQLSPVVANNQAKKLGMGVSIFERLYAPDCTANLKQQYRMNETLMNLANDFVYGGILEMGNPTLSAATLDLNRSLQLKWVANILNDAVTKSFIFLDTSEYLEKHPDKHFSNVNPVECRILKTIIKAMTDAGLKESDIGVITPYRAQIELLKRVIAVNVEINTVDQYQGRDKEAIIFSCTKQDRKNVPKDEFEILSDLKRLTVALTRARKKLIVVGDRQTLVFYRPFCKLFEILKDHQIVRLIDGKDDFFWKNLQA